MTEFTVTITEHERGWGQRNFVRRFATAEEAWQFYDKVNGKNQSGPVPDVYWTAAKPQVSRV